MPMLSGKLREKCFGRLLWFRNCGCVLRSFARRRFTQPAGAINRGIKSSNRKTFVSSNAAFEEMGPLPKIINVSSLASPDDVKFSQSLVNYRRSQNSKFFYHLPIHSQLKLLTRIKCSPVDWPSMHELAQEVNIPVDNMKGWLNKMKSRHLKISALERVPQTKIDILNDEFTLSETLGEDRLLLLSYTLKIDERVIQQFFDSKRDCKKKLRARPTAVSASESKPNLNAAAFGNFLVPCLRLTRCSVPSEKHTHFNNKGRRKIFTREQLTILKDKFSKREFVDREEINRIVQQFGSSVKCADVTHWFAKTRYRLRLKGPSTPVKIEPRSTRSREKEEVPSSPEIIELRSSRSQEKLGAFDNIVKIEPRSDNRLEKFGPIAIAVQNSLFEEYKKSPVLTARRKNVLQTNFKIQSSRIHAFFNKLSALLRGKTESDVTKLLTSYPKAFLSKIAAEHRRNRYISVMRCQKLAKQLGTSRRIVADWFSNARLYELLSGNRFHPIAKPSAQSPLVRELVSVREAKQLSPADATSKAAQSEASDKSIGRKAALNKNAGRNPCFHFSTAVREILFNAFKQSSDLSSSSISRICSASKLSTSQVCLWFRRTRQKLIAIGTAEFLFRSDYRNMNLSQEQIMVLEEKFQKHPYENEVIKEELADQLKVKKGTISSWFQNRRHYDLIIFGLPELVEKRKNKYFSGARKGSVEDTKNVDCQKFHPSNAPEMATSSSDSVTSNFEVRLFQLEDIPSNNSKQNFHRRVDDDCDLLDVTVVKEERLFEESDSPSKMQTSLADVSLTENSSVICRIDSALEKQADGSVPLSEMLERVADNLDSSTDDDDDETHVSQYLSVADGANAVSQLDISDASKLSSLYAPRAEEHPYSRVEPAVMSSIKNSSTEKTVAICEAAIALLEELSMGKPRPPVLKPLANNLEVCKTVAATPEGLSDSSAVLPNVSKSLVSHSEVYETTTAMAKTPADGFNLLFNASIPLAAPVNICTDVAATPEALLDASKPPSDVSKPLVDHSYVSRMETDVHEELSDGPELMADCSDSLAAVSKPLVDDLDVGKTVADLSEERPNCLELSPNISKPQADVLEVSNSLVAAPEELPDTSEPTPDISMPLTDHLDACNTGKTVTTTSEGLPGGLESLPDISEPQNNHLDVHVSNSVAATPEELPDTLKLLPDISMPLADHSKVSDSVAISPEKPESDNTKPLAEHLVDSDSIAATLEELPHSLEPLPDISMPLTDYSEVYNSVTNVPENLPTSSEPLPDKSMLLIDHLVDSNSVVATPEELPCSTKPLADVSVLLADHLEVSHSVANFPERLSDSLKPLPDNSKPLVEHSGVPNTKAATPNELLNGSDPLLDVSKPLVIHSQVLTNGIESLSNEESLCISTEPPISPKNVTDQLESGFSGSSATPKKKKPLFSAIQRKTLLHEYKRSPFVSPPKAQMLASDLNLPVTRIKLWFRQRRCKDTTWMTSKKLIGEKSKQSESSLSFSPFQLFVLKREFSENSILTTERLTHLCQKLKTTREPIIAWFQDRHKAEIAKM